MQSPLFKSNSAQESFQKCRGLFLQRVDRLFVWLLLAQAILLLVSSNRGGLARWSVLVVLPVALLLWRSGKQSTRHAVAATQMFLAAIAANAAGNAVEGHLYFFAALALLALYRDWRLFVTASLWMTFEHWVERAPAWGDYVVVWVIQCSCLAYACQRGLSDQWALAEERAKNAQDLERDSLTGLPNRTGFQGVLKQAITEGTRNAEAFALICLDLDRLQVINEQFGEETGDAVLEESSRRLREAIGGGNDLARLGGDKFVIILRDSDTYADTQQSMTRLLDALKPEFQVAGHSLRVTASAGGALFPEHGVDQAILLANAESAMTRVKSEGRNNSRLFSASVGLAKLDRLMLENDLREALDRGEFHLHYQAQFNFQGELAGLEALLRWNHPRRGNVPPLEFISIAEEAGLILRIGEWVLREACRQYVSWERAGFAPGKIAVNVSAVQLAHPSFAESVKQILKDTGIRPHKLELEITESALMQDLPRAADQLRGLRNLGILLAIDDFGIGYSSLSYLQKLPMTSVKMDRSFLPETPGVWTAELAIIAGIVNLAHSLGLSVIAEGVETEAQRVALEDAGCDAAQGYLFSRPVSPDEAQKLLPGIGRVTSLRPFYAEDHAIAAALE